MEGLGAVGAQRGGRIREWRSWEQLGHRGEKGAGEGGIRGRNARCRKGHEAPGWFLLRVQSMGQSSHTNFTDAAHPLGMGSTGTGREFQAGKEPGGCALCPKPHCHCAPEGQHHPHHSHSQQYFQCSHSSSCPSSLPSPFPVPQNRAGLIVRDLKKKAFF